MESVGIWHFSSVLGVLDGGCRVLASLIWDLYWGCWMGDVGSRHLLFVPGDWGCRILALFMIVVTIIINHVIDVATSTVTITL